MWSRRAKPFWPQEVILLARLSRSPTRWASNSPGSTSLTRRATYSKFNRNRSDAAVTGSSMETSDDDWELSPEVAHPNARRLMKAEYFWDICDDDSPFGNDTG